MPAHCQLHPVSLKITLFLTGFRPFCLPETDAHRFFPDQQRPLYQHAVRSQKGKHLLVRHVPQPVLQMQLFIEYTACVKKLPHGQTGPRSPRPELLRSGIRLLNVPAFIVCALYSYFEAYPSGIEFRELPNAIAATMKAGPWVLLLLYFFLTVAELFISPLGLSFVSKVAPAHMQGLCQGLWLGATALGNLLLWIGPLMYNNWPLWICWSVFLAVCIISMGVMFGMVNWLERVTKA